LLFLRFERSCLKTNSRDYSEINLNCVNKNILHLKKKILSLWRPAQLEYCRMNLSKKRLKPELTQIWFPPFYQWRETHYVRSYLLLVNT